MKKLIFLLVAFLCITACEKEENGIPVKPYVGVPLDKIDAWQKDIFEKCKLIRPGYTPIIGKDDLAFDQYSAGAAAVSAGDALLDDKSASLKDFTTLA